VRGSNCAHSHNIATKAELEHPSAIRKYRRAGISASASIRILVHGDLRFITSIVIINGISFHMYTFRSVTVLM